ncbi:zinc metallopeptidase [Apibacter muscae]|uniref:zinc metallopeptidase n=1 Tax=Apibacter muscae TaxID=2509004 RepID=UPI0011AC0169|nr:zinc metallopeptidase [Apibacter muscae]TWP23439.1 zinc metallopeptidase [Apibacter muscae]
MVYDPIYLMITGAIFIISMIVQNRLKSKFTKYSKTTLSNGMSGKEIAEKMLRDHGIMDVQVISTPGMLTDHYNPANKTVNLSEGVYNQRSTAAAAVAAHECGHAVQHAVGYSMLQLRSKLVPIVSISSNLVQWVLMAGLALMAFSNNTTILAIGIVMFAITTIFAFVTLPVEYDASNRALAWLEGNHIVQSNEYEECKDALKWAARTYLVAALGSLAQLMYFVMILLGNRRSN